MVFHILFRQFRSHYANDSIHSVPVSRPPSRGRSFHDPDPWTDSFHARKPTHSFHGPRGQTSTPPQPVDRLLPHPPTCGQTLSTPRTPWTDSFHTNQPVDRLLSDLLPHWLIPHHRFTLPGLAMRCLCTSGSFVVLASGLMQPLHYHLYNQSLVGKGMIRALVCFVWTMACYVRSSTSNYFLSYDLKHSRTRIFQSYHSASFW